ncbi:MULTISPECIES: DUF3429 domain-containing protein [Halomonadaceae]|uniref:DUF3429 domain-containing protein n=1 Tax=Halomonadaceae TaxID=28256 RepID=UPI00158318DB|nr:MULTISPECIES: DUF3429 domain-containing protein [Halomonas]MDI4637041.1 DUF3429 domain-containing protein [Halomonas sp. BMC7]NUJ58208.1 DUF3429 domain-containing protein [Halomonas taeanensis]
MPLLSLADDRRLPFLLGLAGLLPFLAAALGVWWTPPAWQAFALDAFIYYSAVILSFLGGIHWGFAMGRDAPKSPAFRGRVLLSMAPSLMAWPALLWGGAPGALLLMLGFIAVRGYEASATGMAGLPDWYRGLRNILTVVVVACHLAVIVRLW